MKSHTNWLSKILCNRVFLSSAFVWLAFPLPSCVASFRISIHSGLLGSAVWVPVASVKVMCSGFPSLYSMFQLRMLLVFSQLQSSALSLSIYFLASNSVTPLPLWTSRTASISLPSRSNWRTSSSRLFIFLLLIYLMQIYYFLHIIPQKNVTFPQWIIVIIVFNYYLCRR